MDLIYRSNHDEIQRVHRHPRGRILVITGPRQSGKTTLATMAFPDYPVVTMDSPAERAFYESMRPNDWIVNYPRAVIDEAQKLPVVFDTIKACYDRNPGVRYVLLGSSQIMLLKGIRETLAGRAALCELYPFVLPELISTLSGPRAHISKLVHLLEEPDLARAMPSLFPASLPLDRKDAEAQRAWQYLLHWGGMPTILGSEWSDDDRFQWLRDYQVTYLQRDLSDLARLDRLEPFARAQNAAALKTAQTINFSELARLSGISAPTARQFMRYLEISYQILLLPAWSRNLEKRLAKQPKLHFVDSGVRRAILQRRGKIDGFEFESAVVSEIFKQCRSARLPVELFHLRTTDGREVDLLIEREDGFIAVECKQASQTTYGDFRSTRELGRILNKPLLLSLVVSSDLRPRSFSEKGSEWNVAAHQLLS